MGNDVKCCNAENNTEIIIKKHAEQFFEIYKSMKLILNKIQQKDCKLNIYLIKPKSIPLFIEIIKESEVLEKLERGEDVSECEESLKKLFGRYKRETPEFLKDYKNCEEIIGNNKDNEFIIVDKIFLEKMNCLKVNKDDYVILENRSNKFEIEFPVSTKTLQIKQKTFGIYKFEKCPDNERNNASIRIDNNDDNNPSINNSSQNQIINDNENKYQQLYASSIKEDNEPKNYTGVMIKKNLYKNQDNND